MNKLSENWQKICSLAGRKRRDDGRINKWWLLFTVIITILVIGALLGGMVLAFEIKYQNRFFPGSRLGDLSLGGLNSAQALNLLDQTTERLTGQGVNFVADTEPNLILNMMPMAAADALASADIAQEIYSFDNYQTVFEALNYGRGANRAANLWQQWQILWSDRQFPARFSLNEDLARDLLKQKFGAMDRPALDARPIITWSGEGENETYQITISDEQTGSGFDYGAAVKQLKDNLSRLDNREIDLRQAVALPTIDRAAAVAAQKTISDALDQGDFTFTFQDQKFVLAKKVLADMLIFARPTADSAVIASLEPKKLAAWLMTNVEPNVNQEPRDARAEFSGGKITKIISHQNGQKIDFDATLANAQEALFARQPEVGSILAAPPAEIAVKITPPAITTENINNLGIKEIIGIGQSNFKGSPKNRRHNIGVGMKIVNGLIIKPGEEFSLTTALDPVDASAGYLPELVIKGNKTLPEYGGGLCQVGTTIFRAALASGLPITERAAHAYNVPYYLEDGLPGVDATIYIPHPDVKFVNDTGNYILIQGRIQGDNLYFEFWGAKDGRVATRTKPKVWGWVSPAPTKYVETTDLPVGQKKCTESAHQGVSASFDYIVTYGDGSQKTKTFASKYKPWQAVCLIGVEKLSDPTASSSAMLLSPDVPVPAPVAVAE